MTDMETLIFNTIASALKQEFPDCFCSSSLTTGTVKLPAVSLVQTDSAFVLKTADSSGKEKFTAVTFDLNVYTASDAKKSRAKALFACADALMRDLGFVRVFARPDFSAKDSSIYRMTARYRGISDEAGNLYQKA